MLDTTNVEQYLKDVQAKADELGLREDLEKSLEYLAEYACDDENPDNTKCVLGKDFAPYSFSFTMYKKARCKDVLDEPWKYWFNGGMILHGAHDGHGSGQAPTFSTCLTPTTGWSIHT